MMGKLKFHCPILRFLLFLFACFQVNSAVICNPKQSLALLQFKNTTSFDISVSWAYSGICHPKTDSWVEDRDCCTWDGATCDVVTGNVIGLDLSSSCLKGTIHHNSSLFHLPHLQWLNLAYNNFNGSSISYKFGRLKELTHLNLSSSGFSGPIPFEISHLSKLVLLDLNEDGELDQQTFLLLAHNLTRLSVLSLDRVDMSLVAGDSLLNLSSSIKHLSLTQTGIQGKMPADVLRLPNLEFLDLTFNTFLTGFLPWSNWSSPLRYLLLSNTYLMGKIPDSIGNLKFLEMLGAELCQFTGSIPASIGNLTRLVALKLRLNALTGPVPSSLSKLEKLVHFDLSDNSLAGQVPDIGNLTELELLYLSSNNFSGLLSHDVSRLSYLNILDLSNNFLSGTVPYKFFSLSSLVSLMLDNNTFSGPIDQFEPSNSLQEVNLRNNKITGSIPSSIFELVNLNYLDLSSNNFSGTVQFDMLSKLKNLKTLDLSYNSILSFVSNRSVNYILNNLTSFSLSSCNIISEFPSCLKTLEKLEDLDLSNNKIHGRILKSVLKGWKSLTYLNLSHNLLTSIEEHPWKHILTLDLSNNMLQGSLLVPPPETEFFLVPNNKLSGLIPPSTCNLSLQYLSLSNNNLKGKIPQCLGLMIGLFMLHLRGNNLHGSIPVTFAIGNSLTSLDLSNNELEGPLPKSLVNCSKLEVINVGNNKISDTFPDWLGNLQELKILVLRSNRFYGPIHDYRATSNCSNLQIIDLSHSKFIGSLPRTLFENLGAMMDVSSKESGVKYIGDIYYQDSVILTIKGQEIEIERIMTIFTSIDLSDNHFQGEIPEALGNLKSLLVLNLSHNSLTGNIPLSLGNLMALESLDLSSNKLDGRIPMQLESLTFLEALNLSNNKLSGPIPQGGQLTTFEIDSFMGNKGLCGRPLPEKCNSTRKEPQTPPTILSGKDDTTSEFDWKIMMMGYGSGLVIGLSIGYIVFSTGKPQWLVRMMERKQ